MPGQNSPSQLDAQHTTVWTLSAGVFYDRHEVDIPPQGASFTDNCLFLDGFLRHRAGHKPIQILFDPDPAFHIDLYRPVLDNLDRDGNLLVVKRTDNGTLNLHEIQLSNVCETAGLPISSSLVGTIPAGQVPRFYQGLTPVTDVNAPEFQFGGSQRFTCYSSVNFTGNWYFTSGDDDIWRYDGTEFIPLRTLQPDPDLQNPIGARIITANDARLFIANFVDPEAGVRVPYRLAWSSLLEDNRWGASDFRSGSSAFVDLPEQNEPITALYTSSDFVIVFKPRSIYVGQFVGAPQYYSFRRLARGPGCVSHSSLREYRDGVLIWLGDDNVYAGRPGQIPQPIGAAVEDRIREVADICRMDEARAVIDRDNHIYTLYLPIRDTQATFPLNETTQNYKIFTCHIPTQGWFEGNSSSADVNVTDTIESYTNWWTQRNFVSSFDGQVYLHDLNHPFDKDQNFPVEYTTGLFSYERITDGATQQADLQTIRVHALSGAVTLTHISTNNLDRETASVYGTQVSDGVSELLVTRRDKSTEHFKINIFQPQANLFGLIASWSVSIVPEGDTRRLR